MRLRCVVFCGLVLSILLIALLTTIASVCACRHDQFTMIEHARRSGDQPARAGTPLQTHTGERERERERDQGTTPKAAGHGRIHGM